MRPSSIYHCAPYISLPLSTRPRPDQPRAHRSEGRAWRAWTSPRAARASAQMACISPSRPAMQSAARSAPRLQGASSGPTTSGARMAQTLFLRMVRLRKRACASAPPPLPSHCVCVCVCVCVSRVCACEARVLVLPGHPSPYLHASCSQARKTRPCSRA